MVKPKKKINSFLKKIKRVKKNAAKMKNKKTWPEMEFEKILNELGIQYQDQKIIGTKIYDFLLIEKNIIIEVHGDYWHGKPEMFESLNKIQIKNKKNDVFKKIQALGMGYGYDEVWEGDLKNNRELVVDKIRGLYK